MTRWPAVADELDVCLGRPACEEKGVALTRDGLRVCGQCRRPTRSYMEEMNRIMTTTKTQKAACGFCQTGAHHNCSFAVRNGDGTAVFCGCKKDVEHLATCVDCRRRERSVTTTSGLVLPAADIDRKRARCVDPDDCRLYLESRRIFPERGGQPYDEPVPSDQRTTTGTRPTTKGLAMATSKKTTSAPSSDFRVKAGGGKGTAVLAAISDSKNHGLSRAQLADKVGCTTGRVGEVVRFTLAEGSPAERKAVESFLAAVPSRKAADKPAKPVAKKETSKAAATKKAAAKPAPKKTATKKTAAAKA